MFHRRLAMVSIIFALILNLWRIADHAIGQESHNPRNSPLLDPQSIAFARLNLTQIDPDALEKYLNRAADELKLHPFIANLADRNARHLATRLRRLKELKVERIHLGLTLYGVRTHYDVLLKAPEDHIYAVVAIPAGADPLQIAKVIAEDPPGSPVTRIDKDAAGNPRVWRAKGAPESAWLALHFHSAVHLKNAGDGDIIIAGSPDILEYVANQTAVERPSLSAAFAAAGNGPLQIALAPPAVFARAMHEILGPVKFDGLSLGDTLAEGLQWAAIGLDRQNGELAARLAIQARSADGAKQMQNLIQLLIARAVEEMKKRDAQAGQPDSQLAELFRLITFEINRDQLVWQIDQQHTSPAKIAAALRPVLLGQQVQLGLRQSKSNIRAIGLALHNFHDVYSAFPTPATYDKDGRPLLSWRVHILPYVEEGQLYREFRRDEPWDSPHNKKLIERMPAAYRRPFADAKTTKTPYQAPIGEKTAFRPGAKMAIRNIKDGSSKTIGIVEVDPDHEVIWTKPDDWQVDWNDPTKGLTGAPGNTFVACFLDNAVYSFPKSIDKEVLRRFLMADDGYPVDRPETFAE